MGVNLPNFAEFIRLIARFPEALADIATGIGLQAEERRLEQEREFAALRNRDAFVPIYRIIATVKEIIDTNFFTAVWRGRIFWARAIPDTSSLVVGEMRVLTRIRSSTEYFTLIGGYSGLWIHPGSNLSGSDDLWLLPPGGTVAEHVWDLPTSTSNLVAVMWSQIDQSFYVSGGRTAGTDLTRLYKISLVDLATTVMWTLTESLTSGGGGGGGHYWAEFHGKLYFLERNSNDSFRYVYRWDPIVGGSPEIVHSITYGNVLDANDGIAVDPTNDQIIVITREEAGANDLSAVYRSSTGDLGSWTFEVDFDVLAGRTTSLRQIITNRGTTDPVHAGIQYAGGSIPPETVLFRRTGVGTWVSDLIMSTANRPFRTMGTEYDSAGNAIALYGITEAGGEIWRKPAGGSWALDTTLPFLNPLSNKGIACFEGNVYALGSVGGNVFELWKRSPTGVWSFVQQWTNRLSTGYMTVAPNNVRLMHEV